jgi:flagellar basal body-associated protein FliL
MAGKKNKDAATPAGADAVKKSGKGKAMALGAALVIVGAMGQKFLLSSSPAQVIIAPPVNGGVEVVAAATHELDCSGVQGATAAEEPHARRSGGGAAAAGGTADLSSMTINLADGHFLKVGITLELGESVVAEEFTTQTARASDVALNYFSSKSMEQLTSAQHAAIKVELACLIDAAYTAHADDEAADAEVERTVTGVLFREFLTS